MDNLFGSKSKVRLLRLLSKDPKRVWTERELAKALGMSPNNINISARELRNAGVIDFHRIGRSHAVRLRADLKLAQSLEAVFYQESLLWEDWKSAVSGVVPVGATCVLYGSTARGTASAESDIDLVVVADSRPAAEEVASKVRAASATLMPLPLEIIALDRATARRRKRSSFFRGILRDGQPLSLTKLEELL